MKLRYNISNIVFMKTEVSPCYLKRGKVMCKVRSVYKKVKEDLQTGSLTDLKNLENPENRKRKLRQVTVTVNRFC